MAATNEQTFSDPLEFVARARAIVDAMMEKEPVAGRLLLSTVEILELSIKSHPDKTEEFIAMFIQAFADHEKSRSDVTEEAVDGLNDITKSASDYLFKSTELGTDQFNWVISYPFDELTDKLGEKVDIKYLACLIDAIFRQKCDVIQPTDEYMPTNLPNYFAEDLSEYGRWVTGVSYRKSPPPPELRQTVVTLMNLYERVKDREGNSYFLPEGLYDRINEWLLDVETSSKSAGKT